jgi:hypothetical protein
MRSRDYSIGAPGCHFTAPLARWAKPFLAVVLVLTMTARGQAQSGVSAMPSSLDFGDQSVNGPGADRQVEIHNGSSGTVVISSLQITNDSMNEFAIQNDPCQGALNQGASCTAHILFRPKQPGPRSATLAITTDAQPPIMISLSGNGVTGITLPMITCPSNRNATTAAGQLTATIDVGAATATGDGVSVVGVRSDGQPLGDPYPIGSTFITWTATDRSSHQVTCVQTVTVGATAQSLPISCPPNQSVPVDAGGTSAHVVPGTATSSPGAMIVGVRSDGKALTAPYPAGTTTITWIAADSSGSAGTCTQTITVGFPSLAAPSPSVFVDPTSANPQVEGVTPGQGPLYQRVIIHGSGFADAQGTSRVLLGGRPVSVLAWSATAIAAVFNPLAFDPSPLALNATYPVQVIAPAAGRRSNSVDFSLTDGAPANYPTSGGKGPSAHPHITSFQRPLFCPGDTVLFLGTGFGSAQGIGYVALTVPLADPNGNLVHQTFAVPVLSWSENAISFALNLPAGAIPGTYTITVHHSSGSTAAADCTVGARTANGDCTAPN